MKLALKPGVNVVLNNSKHFPFIFNYLNFSQGNVCNFRVASSYFPAAYPNNWRPFKVALCPGIIIIIKTKTFCTCPEGELRPEKIYEKCESRTTLRQQITNCNWEERRIFGESGIKIKPEGALAGDKLENCNKNKAAGGLFFFP